MNRSLYFYILLSLFVFGWWAIAFRDVVWKADRPIESKTLPIELSKSNSPHLSSLNREELMLALQGDFALMARKIVEWDHDAVLLETSGGSAIQRLPSDTFKRSIYLSKKVEENQKVSSQNKYLPQTYASVVFLLTLLDQNSIAALPRGFFTYNRFIPRTKTENILLSLDRFELEKIYLAKPSLVFVSALYSDPPMVQALRNMGISIVYTPSISKINDLYASLRLIGDSVGKSEEAELLNLFMEACFCAIDNRWLGSLAENKVPFIQQNTLYLNYNMTFQLPSSQTVLFDLLKRLKISQVIKLQEEGKTTFTQERLLQLNPEYLILSCRDRSQFEHLLVHYPALKSLNAIRHHNIFWVDDDLQQTPTHYVILAYFDIVQALMHMRTP